MANGWTLERRQRQAEIIRTWCPWKSSTGPRTESGKATVARNAWKGGRRAHMREVRKALAAQGNTLQDLCACLIAKESR